MKIILSIIVFTLNFTNLLFGQGNYSIKAEVVSIEYFSESNCSTNAPLLVRVTYNINGIDCNKLKMRHIYSDGIQVCSSVNFIDKKGNCVYDFCAKENKKVIFKTVFVTEKGEKSNEVFVYVNPVSSKVIAGTAPKIIKIN